MPTCMQIWRIDETGLPGGTHFSIPRAFAGYFKPSGIVQRFKQKFGFPAMTSFESLQEMRVHHGHQGRSHGPNDVRTEYEDDVAGVGVPTGKVFFNDWLFEIGGLTSQVYLGMHPRTYHATGAAEVIRGVAVQLDRAGEFWIPDDFHPANRATIPGTDPHLSVFIQGIDTLCGTFPIKCK